MVGCGLPCPGGGVPGCRGASSGSQGGGGTVGASIRGPGPGGGRNTEHGTIYTHTHMCVCVSHRFICTMLPRTHANMFAMRPTGTKSSPTPGLLAPSRLSTCGSSAGHQQD